MYKRNDYIKGNISYNEYYNQFVTQYVMGRVLERFSYEVLRRSWEVDEHFNTKITPLRAWDNMCDADEELRNLLKEAGEGVTVGVLVCVYKQAAYRLIGVK